MPELDPGVMKSFEDAFADRVGSCRGDCACGREFYNEDGGWSFEEGEIAGLESRKATNLDYAVGFITFEGCTYVIDCECWKPRAGKIAAFLVGHAHKIAAFLTEEKRRKAKEADDAPVVEEVAHG